MDINPNACAGSLILLLLKSRYVKLIKGTFVNISIFLILLLDNFNLSKSLKGNSDKQIKILYQ